MSAINPEELKSASDPNIPFFTFPENFTINQLRHDTLIEFGQIIKSLKIINNDNLAVVTFRTQSPSGLLRTVDPASELSIDEWTSYLEINPNGVSGNGQIELDMVELNNAKQRV